MAFEYRMVQVPPNIAVRAREHRGKEAAAYLGRGVNEYARHGWEFYRVDSIGVNVQPGCFDALFGRKAQSATYYVVTFRRR
ncbi:hypothetical protein GCM10011400_59220 [Paraburkholderia caffeinilytica]|uniref:DUF4177 domain-containing protein n=1 Tax=Paraburkholderia caffeinilytica TaxID=1761016 RepID=A0ABQ1N9V0_9BURK|nr:hypothetical protein GCM10011400_59220 [Paraburkholderia caffeinilytica]